MYLEESVEWAMGGVGEGEGGIEMTQIYMYKILHKLKIYLKMCRNVMEMSLRKVSAFILVNSE